MPRAYILSLVSAFYQAFRDNFAVQAMLSGMKSGVGAVIVSVVYDMGSGIVKARDPVLLCIMIAAFAANYVFHVNVILIILTAAAVGAVRTVRREKRKDVPS